MKTPKPEIIMGQKGLGLILKDNKLKVPPHQREYSWTQKQVGKLFEDLAKAINDEPEYFLGTIATIREGNGVLRVIDGQQRLATITILLCAIRNYLRPLDDFMASSVVKQYLEYPDADQRANVPRMRLNSNDNEFFAKMLMVATVEDRPEPILFSHRLILAAFEAAEIRVQKIVSGFNIKDHGDMLNKWVSYIEENAEVILLQMPSGYNAYKMFETLNDRGLETTQADMVKSYLFEQAESNDRLSEAETSWAKLRGALDSLQGEKDISVVFIRHALILIHGPLTKDQILDVVQTRAKGAGTAVALCKQLEQLAGTYTATFYADHEKWSSYPDAVKLAIQTLNFFNIQPFRPIIMAVAEVYEPKEAIKAYEVLISLGVRITIASSTSHGNVEETLNAVAHRIYKREISTAKVMREALEPIFPGDEKFRAAFAVATVSKSPLAKYYLRTLERVVKKEPTPWYNVNDDKEVINLEHILPESKGENWPQFSDQEAENYWKRLGNMALHSKKINSDLRSAPFSEKRPTYKECPYKLTSQIATAEDWTVGMINKRQTQMADFAVKAWKY
jgi:hypothetical protein